MNDVVHCPDCGAENRAGYTICTECGALLEPGPTHRVAPASFAYRADTDDDGSASPADLFEREERPPKRLILAVMVEDDAPGLIEALGAEGSGTRLGERTEDGGVEVLIHDTNLAAAQAVLVEYTGDPSLVDAVVEAGDDDATDDDDDPFVEIASGVLAGMATQLARLRDAGIEVRVETATGDDLGRSTGALMVPSDDLERARTVLGITL
jgi:zinc-ribbon domain